MIKTLSINLGGIVFQIDEDAYDKLRQYLDSLTRYYKYTEGRDEIVSDIEARLAELFTERQASSGFNVISNADVEEVVAIMGNPEDFDDEGDRMTDGPATGRKTFATNGKRLYRDEDDGVLAGVCSGLAAYWGVKDPLWIRLAFIATALFSAFTVGVIIYIILWIVVPNAKTSAQKLEMRGEAVNVNNLEKKIRESIVDAGENLREFANSERSNSALREVVNAIGKIFGVVAKIFLVLFKVVFGIVIAAMILAGIAALLGLLVSFAVALPLSLKYIFAGPGSWLLALFGGLLVILIPLLSLVYLPFRIFGGKRIQNESVKLSALGAFILGIIFCFAAATIAASYFSEREIVATQVEVPQPVGDTLYLSLNPDEESYEGLDYDIHFSGLLSFAHELETASDWVELDIVPSLDDKIYLEKTFRSRGKTRKHAAANASAITYNVEYLANGIQFDPIFGLGARKKWRSQSVKLRLKVPQGMVVVPKPEVAEILDDAANSINAGHYTIAGNRWMMNNGRLEPIDSLLQGGSEWQRKNMQFLGYSDFDQLELEGGLDVEIVQGDKFEVYVSDDRSAGTVDFEMDGNKLVIRGEDDSWGDISIGFINSKRRIDPKVYITMPDLESLRVRRQAYVTIEGLQQEELSMDIGGQSVVILHDLNAGNLTVELHAQSYLELSGKARDMELETSAQSNVDGEDFRVETLRLEMSAQSDAEMVVTGLIEGDMFGQSSFAYWGNPEVDVTTHAQSSISNND